MQYCYRCEQKRELAVASLAFNCRDKDFRALFPHLVEIHNQQKESDATIVAPSSE